jgi:hypothetical protein
VFPDNMTCEREEIRDILQFKLGKRKIDFKFELYDHKNRFLSDLKSIVNCSIRYDALADIKRTAQITLKDEPLDQAYEIKNYSFTAKMKDHLSGGIKNNVETGSTQDDDGQTHYYVSLTGGNSTGSISNWDFESGLSGWVPVSSSCQITLTKGYYESPSVVCKKTVSDTKLNGIRLDVQPLSVSAGQKMYIRFAYKLTGNVVDLNKVSFYTGSNAYFVENVVTYPLVDGWRLYMGELAAPVAGNYGLNIGSDTQGTSLEGEIWIDWVYFSTTAEVWRGMFTSPEIDLSNPDGDFSSDRVDNDTYSYYWVLQKGMVGNGEVSYSLDGGITWSSWYPTSVIALNSGVLPLSTNTSRLKVKYRFILTRGRPKTIGQLRDFEWYITKSYISEGEQKSINFGSNRIKVYCEIIKDDGTKSKCLTFPVGIFLLSSPTRQDKNGGTYRQIECYDELLILKEDKITARLTIREGTKYTECIRAILRSSGIDRFNIYESDKALNRTIEYPIGTTKLEIINDLLTQINYQSLYVDANGVFTVRPYENPSQKGITWEYKDDELSVIMKGMTEEYDQYNHPNVFTVVQSSENSTMTYSIENFGVGPSSINSVKRRIVDYREVSDVSDFESLKEYTQRIFEESLQNLEVIEFETAIMPFHDHMDALNIRYQPLDINGKYIETNWEFECKPGATMRHRARKVVTVDYDDEQATTSRYVQRYF